MQMASLAADTQREWVNELVILGSVLVVFRLLFRLNGAVCDAISFRVTGNALLLHRAKLVL